MPGYRKRTTAGSGTTKFLKKYHKKKATYSSKNRRTGGFRGIEVKFVDAQRSSTAMTVAWTSIAPSAGIVGCISCPQQGVGESQHLGRTFYIKSIFVRGTIRISNDETLTNPQNNVDWRVALVLDKQTNGSAATGPLVMDAGAVNDVLSFRNLQNSHRFSILRDTGRRIIRPHNVNLGAINLFAIGETRQGFSFNYVFKKPLKVRTDGTAADVANVTDFALILVGVCSVVGPDISYDSRMRYSETTAQ